MPSRNGQRLTDKKIVGQARSRAETRLALPSQANPEAAESVLKQVIEDWLLPSLLDEFLTEHGVTPNSRFLAKPQ